MQIGLKDEDRQLLQHLAETFSALGKDINKGLSDLNKNVANLNKILKERK